MAAASFTGGDRKWIERFGLGFRLRPDCRMADDFRQADQQPALVLKLNAFEGNPGFEILAIDLKVKDHQAAVESGVEVVFGKA